LLGQVPCRAGCSHCCLGPFPITILDVQTLQEGLKGLAPSTRTLIEQTAFEQVRVMEAAFPPLINTPFLDGWPDRDIDHLVTQFDTTPCPALSDDGLCLVYPHRPLACRSMGIPTEEAGTVQGACQVQTFVPVLRLASSLRSEEEDLARQEADALIRCRETGRLDGEEVLLPFGFLPEPIGRSKRPGT
jgi:Fe-S-cluster containining protein